jgi:hypothetical protein
MPSILTIGGIIGALIFVAAVTSNPSPDPSPATVISPVSEEKQESDSIEPVITNIVETEKTEAESVIEFIPTPKTAPAQTPTPKPAVAPATTPVSKPASNCHPSYSGCLKMNAGDYDCASGSGNGPNYTGAVQVYGSDPFDLDRDNDGWGCE